MTDYYRSMVHGGERTIDLTADEEAAVLHAYDEGVDALDADERHQLNRVLAKLKDKIWP